MEIHALLRKISTQLPEYNCFLMHGAVVAVDGSGYMFTGWRMDTKDSKWLIISYLEC